MKYPLWGPGNLSMVSSLFVVHPGKCVLLTGANFAAYKSQDDSSKSFRVAQMACVERLLFDYAPSILKNARSCDCDWLFDITKVGASEANAAAVASGGCHWTLSACDNMRIVGLPGSYRLRLNDPTATGVVQVYAELYDASQIPVQLTGMFYQ